MPLCAVLGADRAFGAGVGSGRCRVALLTAVRRTVLRFAILYRGNEVQEECRVGDGDESGGGA